jgi:hypothetical protein
VPLVNLLNEYMLEGHSSTAMRRICRCSRVTGRPPPITGCGCERRARRVANGGHARVALEMIRELYLIVRALWHRDQPLHRKCFRRVCSARRFTTRSGRGPSSSASGRSWPQRLALQRYREGRDRQR